MAGGSGEGVGEVAGDGGAGGGGHGGEGVEHAPDGGGKCTGVAGGETEGSVAGEDVEHRDVAANQGQAKQARFHGGKTEAFGT